MTPGPEPNQGAPQQVPPPLEGGDGGVGPEPEGQAGGPDPGTPPEASADPSAPAPPRRRRGYWIPGVIAVAALTAIGVAFGAGDLNHSSPQTLYGSDMAQAIALGIQAREGTHTSPDIRCPATEPVRQGHRFVCTRSEPGKTVPVQVVEVDSHGHLQWSLGG